jgi:beta-alanine degradation protein BauB
MSNAAVRFWPPWPRSPVSTQRKRWTRPARNERVRVLEFISRPGMGVCGTGMHSHPAHLTIALSPAKVRVKLPDGSTIQVQNDVGDVFWSEAETHETENLTGRDVRALIVELKTPPLRG